MKIIKDTSCGEYGVLFNEDPIPEIHFYNKDEQSYDSAYYTSSNAAKRYKIIKDISNLKEFFRFKNAN